MRQIPLVLVLLLLAWSCAPAEEGRVSADDLSQDPAVGQTPSPTTPSVSPADSGSKALKAPELDDMGDVGLVPVLFPSFLAGGSDTDCDFSDPFGSCH